MQSDSEQLLDESAQDTDIYVEPEIAEGVVSSAVAENDLGSNGSERATSDQYHEVADNAQPSDMLSGLDDSNMYDAAGEVNSEMLWGKQRFFFLAPGVAVQAS